MEKNIFYSKTGKPLTKANLSDSDSEEEIDDSWVLEQEKNTIDDLSNINTEEKHFMKLWNTHMYSPLVKNMLALEKCIKFVEEYHKEIIKIRSQWGMHLITLLEYNTITYDDLLLIQLILASKSQIIK